MKLKITLIAKRVLSEPAVITLSILLFLFTSAGMVAVYWRWTRTDRCCGYLGHPVLNKSQLASGLPGFIESR